MERKKISIGGVPSIIWGSPSDNLYVYVHGQKGSKDEAEAFAEIVQVYGWQVLSIDLPGHGEREPDDLYPWRVVPELSAVMLYAKNWGRISLFANSIGAWFSMLSFADGNLGDCLFVSPVIDMESIILKMMTWSDVSEERLRKESLVKTPFGETLSWEYLLYARQHKIVKWNVPTKILYGGKDNITERAAINEFSDRFACKLSVMDNGEHWFHTPEQLEFLHKWISESIA